MDAPCFDRVYVVYVANLQRLLPVEATVHSSTSTGMRPEWQRLSLLLYKRVTLSDGQLYSMYGVPR